MSIPIIGLPDNQDFDVNQSAPPPNSPNSDSGMINTSLNADELTALLKKKFSELNEEK